MNGAIAPNGAQTRLFICMHIDEPPLVLTAIYLSLHQVVPFRSSIYHLCNRR